MAAVEAKIGFDGWNFGNRCVLGVLTCVQNFIMIRDMTLKSRAHLAQNVSLISLYKQINMV